MVWQEWQALADDTSAWIGRAEKGILKAEHVRDHVLRLWFDDGPDVAIYELDFAPLFVADNPGGVFSVLRDAERFGAVRGDYALIWPIPDASGSDEGGIDIAPECIRFYCERYGRLLKESRARAA